MKKLLIFSFVIKLLSILLLISALLFIWLKMFNLRLNPGWYNFCKEVPVNQEEYNKAQEECRSNPNDDTLSIKEYTGRLACIKNKNIPMKKRCSFPKLFLPTR